jgi:hypothetical protein
LMSPLVTPVAAFTWGFDYDGGRPVNVQSPRLAEPAAWTEHRQFLGGTLPGWDFAIEPPQQEIVGA